MGRLLTVLLGLVLVLLIVIGNAWGDFVLTGSDHLNVTSSHTTGILWDYSTADVKNGGSVTNLYSNDTSSVTVSGGNIRFLYSYGTSNVILSDGNIDFLDGYGTSKAVVSGGHIDYLYNYDTSSTSISGGSIKTMVALNTSSMSISGGSITDLLAIGSSSFTFYGYDFRAMGDVSLQGDKVLGTGALAGKWLDGTPWVTNIIQHDGGATILMGVPEPSTVVLLVAGGLCLLIYAWRRRRTM